MSSYINRHQERLFNGCIVFLSIDIVYMTSPSLWKFSSLPQHHLGYYKPCCEELNYKYFFAQFSHSRLGWLEITHGNGQLTSNMAKILSLWIANLSTLMTFQLDIEGLSVYVGVGEYKGIPERIKKARLYLFISKIQM